jgi:hypothetical protein
MKAVRRWERKKVGRSEGKKVGRVEGKKKESKRLAGEVLLKGP